MKYLVYKTRDVFMWSFVVLTLLSALTATVFGFIVLGQHVLGGPSFHCIGASTSDKIRYYSGDKDTETQQSCTKWVRVK